MTTARHDGTFALSSVIFVRLLALVHIIAFASAGAQISALVGPHGISPAGQYLAAAHEQLGPAAYWQLPTLAWWFGTDAFLSVLCALGVSVGLLLLVGIAPGACLLALWVGYLSLVNVGQMFWGYQWDGLLLEATLLAMFVVPWRALPLWHAEDPPRAARWLLWWLLFRLIFFAGVVKLSSGDPSWRDLTALAFHYETQPLPTPLAWYAHQAPWWWHKLECGAMFAVELGAPWLIFLPRAARHVSALIMAAFMAAVALAGNYTFFNFLAITLCLFCLDDRWWMTVRIGRSRRPAPGVAANTDRGVPIAAASAAAHGAPRGNPARDDRAARQSRHAWRERITLGFAIFAFGYTGAISIATFLPPLRSLPGLDRAERLIDPLRSFNRYGLFAVMTHPRPELIIEGSYDGREWQPYEFPAKPGDLFARPRFVAPHQPRLDWQLWFAALEDPRQNPWVLSLCEHLLRGTPEVLKLIAKNPFPDRPPRYIRVVRYEYHFTTRADRARHGAWWRRTPTDLYVAPATLKPPP